MILGDVFTTLISASFIIVGLVVLILIPMVVIYLVTAVYLAIKRVKRGGRHD